MYMNATPITVHFERGNVSIDVRCSGSKVLTTSEIALILTQLNTLCDKMGVIDK